MYYKRPSFKRGGSTGIAQLTPSRQGYAGGGNIGGGTMMGSNLGTRSGFQTTIPKASAGFPYSMGNTTYDFSQNNTTPIKETRGIEEILSGSDNRRSQFSETMTVEDLYKKRGEKLKRSADWVEETFGGDNTYIDKNNIKRSRQTGEVITDTASKSGIGQLTFTEADDIRQNYQFNQANEIVERAKDDKTTIELGAKDSSITLDPLKEIEREKNFLNNLLQNKGLERGEAALVAAKAIGTAGSFKDKLDAAVDMALPIVRKRNEQDKAVTLTAYKAFKEKEAAQAKAQVDAGKPTNELKNINLMAQAIKNQGDKRNLSVIRDELVVRQSGMDSDIKKIMLEATPNVINLVKDINKQRKLLAIENSKKKPKEKNIEKIKENITGYEDDLKDLQSIGKDSFDSLFGDLTKGYFAEGGRVKRQLGSPEIGEQIVKTEDTVVSMPGGSVPEKPVLNLSYDELRNRLPKSITDDIIQLLANSEEALQEFAYITSQDDVNSFNVKYGVNLIIPPTTG
jgi:hypothetical protein